MPEQPTPRHSPLVAAVALIAACCALACLFLIELFPGKLLLPRFGGAPVVWVSCLAFFQLALVATAVTLLLLGTLWIGDDTNGPARKLVHEPRATPVPCGRPSGHGNLAPAHR
jgi:hypothetical protein